MQRVSWWACAKVKVLPALTLHEVLLLQQKNDISPLKCENLTVQQFWMRLCGLHSNDHKQITCHFSFTGTFFFFSCQLHCMWFPPKISNICCHCFAAFMSSSLLCYFRLADITQKQLSGLKMLLILSCWIIAGKMHENRVSIIRYYGCMYLFFVIF